MVKEWLEQPLYYGTTGVSALFPLLLFLFRKIRIAVMGIAEAFRYPALVNAVL
jgi:hypothetical protein